MIAVWSVAKRQIRFLWLLEPIKRWPALPVQIFSISRGRGFGVESERQVHPFDPFPFIAKVGAADDCDHDVKKRDPVAEEGD